MRAVVLRVVGGCGCLLAVVSALVLSFNGATSSAAGTSAFAPAVGSPYATDVTPDGNPISAAVSPDGSLLAVANMSNNDVAVFSVAASGALTALPGSPYATGHSPAAVAFDPASSLPILEVVNANSQTVEPFVEISGRFVAGTPASTGATGSPESLSFDAGGTLLAVRVSDDKVAMFEVGLDGEPTLLGGTQQALAGAAANSVALSPDGATLAVGDGTDQRVELYSVNSATGQLGSRLSASPLSVGSSGGVLHVGFSPDGTRLAVTDRNGNSVSLFDVPAYGAPVATAAFDSPTQLAFSPRSGLLSVAGAGSAAVYAIGAAGALSAVPGSPFTIDATSPISGVAFARTGGVLAALDEDGNQVATLAVGAPAATIGAPAQGGSYALGQSVPTSFGCADAPDGPGIASCTDSGGAAAGSGKLDTSTTGHHTYSVTAASADGQAQTSSITYDVVAPPPTATITAPAAGASYTIGQAVTTSYSCASTPGGPVISSCAGTLANNATLPTDTAGSYSFTVTATTADGQKATTTVDYTVAPAAPPAGNTVTLKLGSGAATPVDLVGSGLTFPKTTVSIAVAGALGAKEQEFAVEVDQKDNDPTAFKAVSSEGAHWDTAMLTITNKTGTTIKYTFSDVQITSSQRTGTQAGEKIVTFAYASAKITTSSTKVPIPTSVKLVKTKKLGLSFTGTIVHLIPTAQSFVLAEADGQLVAIHSSDSRIKVGRLVTAKAMPLANGTYRATKLTFTHHTKIALLQGTVTFVSRAGRYFVISGSGASIGIYRLARGAKTPPLGEAVTILVAIHGNALVQETIRQVRKTGVSCVEGQFVGLTTVMVGGQPQLELEVATTDAPSPNAETGKLRFPLTGTQSQSLSVVVASGTHMLKLCGIDERASGLQATIWKHTVSAYTDSSNPEKLF